MDFCAICGSPLDLVDILSLPPEGLQGEFFCADCESDEDLMEEYAYA
jgi:hypothetical protein